MSGVTSAADDRSRLVAARQAKFRALDDALGAMLSNPSRDPGALAGAIDGLIRRHGGHSPEYLRTAERAVDVLVDLCWEDRNEPGVIGWWYRKLGLWSVFHEDVEFSHRLYRKALIHCRDPRWIAPTRHKVARFARLVQREASTQS